MHTALLRFLIVFANAVILTIGTVAQPGMVDPLFRINDTGLGDGANGNVNAAIFQANGSIVIGGEFAQFDGTPVGQFARLNSNGYLDPTFQTGTGFNGYVNSIIQLPNGKMIVGGGFTTYNSISCGSVVRLEADGNLDPTFNNSIATGASVQDMSMYPDGSILIAGDFDTIGGEPRSCLAKLTSDGNLDPALIPLLFNSFSWVEQASVMTDGRILATGTFFTYGGITARRVIILLSDGTIDPSFNPGTGVVGSIYSHLELNDGRILLTGDFSEFNGVACNNIIMLLADGTIDPSFTAGFLDQYPYVPFISQRSDQSILLAGDFSNYSSTPVRNIVNIDLNGTLLPTFNSGLISFHDVATVAETPNGELFIGGNLYYDSIWSHVELLEPDGSVIDWFHECSGFDGEIKDISFDPNDQLNIGGQFTTEGLSETTNVAKLDGNGNPVPSFNQVQGINGTVNCVVGLADGSVIIGGSFSTVQGIGRKGLARIAPNGTLDQSFTANIGDNEQVTAMTIQADGELIVVGSFDSINNVPADRFARIQQDGSFGSPFSAYTDPLFLPLSIAIQPDGKPIVGGRINSLDYLLPVPNSPPNLIRFNQDGSTDFTFDCGYGATHIDPDDDGDHPEILNRSVQVPPPPPPPIPEIRSIRIQEDGMILIGGLFAKYDSVPSASVARIFPDGSVDLSFAAQVFPQCVQNITNDLVLQPDGKVVICGQYRHQSCAGKWQVIRLETNGALDPSFYVAQGATGYLNTLALDSENRILAGGAFNSYNGIGRNRIVRLLNDGMVVGSEQNPQKALNTSAISAFHDGTRLHYRNNEGLTSYQILDLLGRELISGSLAAENGSISFQATTGIYIFRAHAKSEKSESTRFVVD